MQGRWSVSQIGQASSRSMAPQIQCPKCGQISAVLNAIELVVGSQVECPGCGRTLECVKLDNVLYWQWNDVVES